jgi:hypothetical protein
MQSCVIVDHQGQVKLPGTISGDGYADKSASFRCHEIDHLFGAQLGRRDQITFILAVFVIDDDDAFAGTERFECCFYAIKHAG